MLKLALEIPTSMLVRWAPLTDLDFILAHKVLQDEEYANFFRTRPEGKELILDNSTHEFGTPLPMENLLHAAKLCAANIVIAPDIVNEGIHDAQYWQNIRWVRDAAKVFTGTTFDLGSVLCGHTRGDRANYLSETVGFSQMMCFTFHDSHRLEWWRTFVEHPLARHWKRIHILGVSSLNELRTWYKYSTVYPEFSFSVDTTKAVKWGAQGMKLDELDSLRGGPIDAKAVLEINEFTPQQISCVEYNIELLKKICRGKA